MAGKKQRLAGLLYRARVLGLLSRAAGSRLLAFGHHRIRPDDPGFSSAFADDVFGPTASEFEAQVMWLKQNTHVLSEDDLLEIAGGAPPPAGVSTLLTFDDGYKDNFTLALPILERHGVPAIFFVPSENIEQRKLGWWDQIAYLLKRTTRETLALDGVRYELVDRDAAIARLHKRMQLEPAAQTVHLVERVAEAADVHLPDRAVRDAELMTWDELAEAAARGMAVGSHTRSHRVLATLSADAQAEELTASKAWIEERIGRPVRTLAYPVGGYRHFTAQTARLAQEAGYAAAFSFCTGFNRWDTLAPFDIKRIGAPSDPSLFAATAILPEVFDWE